MPTITTSTRRLRLTDDTGVALRPMRADDRVVVHELLDGLSEQARFHRFFRALPEIPAWAVDSLCRVDDHDHTGRLAIADSGRAAGVAQFFRDPDLWSRAEVALTIATAHQRCGLGALLLHELAVEAGHGGIETFTYMASPGNRPAIQLLRSLGARSFFDGGLVHGSVPVDRLRLLAERRFGRAEHQLTA